MKLKSYDHKCVTITTTSGEVYEGVAAYYGKDYVFHEYGEDQEALFLTPIIFYKEDISSVLSLESVNGPFGHFSSAYGLLEIKCLEWGTDMIEEVFDTKDESQILRMLTCMQDHFSSVADRAVYGMAPWRTNQASIDDDDNEMGPIYLGELERMLKELMRYSGNDEVVEKAKELLVRLSDVFSKNDD